jgi:hypothetical protein
VPRLGRAPALGLCILLHVCECEKVSRTKQNGLSSFSAYIILRIWAVKSAGTLQLPQHAESALCQHFGMNTAEKPAFGRLVLFSMHITLKGL